MKRATSSRSVWGDMSVKCSKRLTSEIVRVFSVAVIATAVAACSGGGTADEAQADPVDGPDGVTQGSPGNPGAPPDTDGDPTQNAPRLVVQGTASVPSSGTDCELPPGSGVIDIAGVPVGPEHRVWIRYAFSQPVTQTSTFDVWFEGDDTQRAQTYGEDGSPGRVQLTIREGETLSDPPFQVEGIAVGQAMLRRGAFGPYPATATPIIVWALDDVVDYNALGEQDWACYKPGADSPALQDDMADRTTCGTRPKAVAADGTSLLLVRLKAGAYGRACFTFPAADRDRMEYYGKFSDPIAGGRFTDTPATNVTSLLHNGLLWAFGTYTPPSDFIESGKPDRQVEVEVQFTPQNQDGSPIRSNITAVKRKIRIVRPPVLLVHGLWGDSSTWGKAFLDPKPKRGRLIDGTYSYNGNLPYTQPQPAGWTGLGQRIKDLVSESRNAAIATTKVDIVAHSMGGLVSKQWLRDAQYRRADNYNAGDINKLATITSPHWGSKLANALINLHAHFVDPETGVHDERLRQLEENTGDPHHGAICELAENSPALESNALTYVRALAYTAAGGRQGEWMGEGLIDVGIYKYIHAFSPEERVQHSDPYLLNEPNDGIVTVASQADGLPVSQNFDDHLHTALDVASKLFGPTMTSSRSVAERVYLDLDRPDGWIDAVPPYEVFPHLYGEPLSGGRGAEIDHANYQSQCTPGGPMYGYLGP